MDLAPIIVFLLTFVFFGLHLSFRRWAKKRERLELLPTNIMLSVPDATEKRTTLDAAPIQPPIRYSKPYRTPPKPKPAWLLYHKQLMMCLISLAVLIGSLVVILVDGYPEGSQNWAFGALGSVIGFWLRGKD